MFNLKKKEVSSTTSEVRPALELVKPVAKEPVANVAQLTLKTYEDLSSELGFIPAQLLEAKLLLFLHEEKMPVYDYREVHKYLAVLANKEKKIWTWRPLREKDKPNGWHWGDTVRDWEGGWSPGHGSYRDTWNYRPYDKAIPIHILRRVKKIQDQFEDKVLFFVSDYAVPQPDPFIMVTALDISRIIFGVWDEPGFE